MLRRTRTTKTLAKRMDLQYFAKPHPLRRWRLWLSVAIPVVALVWIVSQQATGEKAYSSGPLASSHAVFGKKCEVCHESTLGFFSKQVSDKKCLACHDAPAHHEEKASFTPACGACHVEHKGSLRLASTMDAGCTQCHANLGDHIKGTTQYVKDVADFDNQHPEFAALRPGMSDPGKVKLNHYKHLVPNLAGPHGPVQLDCHDCHRPAGMEGAWPYAGAEVKMVSATIGSQAKSADRAYMAPIRYAEQCEGCHVKDLQFDKRFDEAVPHDRPDVVQAFLYRKYDEYFSTHPNALAEPIAPERMLPGKFYPPPPVPHNRQEWITLQVMLSDRILWGKGCKLCHTMIQPDDPQQLPTVAKSNIPVRWLPHAEFDHDSHRLLACDSCHVKSRNSQDTADVLVPGIASCRTCHKQAGPQVDAANGRCSECHEYHDWTKEKPVKGKYTITGLRGGGKSGE
ncbi:MAG: hypothetical protein LAN63_09720 [Acidobacteriia bacterium]|nr:hypothetical protein [Terriglobia bacterium]